MDNVLKMEESISPGAGRSKAYEEAVAVRRAGLRDELESLLSGTGAPFLLEVGSGHGHFLTSYAKRHPDQFCVGIDLMTDRVRRATKKRDRSGLSNLAFLKCEAMEFLDCLPEGIVFQRVFVLFPDPWPKQRHHKNRLLSGRFFDAMSERTVPGAELYFRTDFEPYFKEVRDVVAGHGSWMEQATEAWPFEEPTVFQQRAAVFHSLMARRACKPRESVAVKESPSRTSGTPG